MTEMDHTNPVDGAGEAENRLSRLEELQIICVIGGPGVGKGTHCTNLANDLDAAHMSVGDLLRADPQILSAEEKTVVNAAMQEGKLAPTKVVQKVLTHYIRQEVHRGTTRILLDGFPRSMEQMTLFETSDFKIKAVLVFQGSRTTLLSRMLKRAETSGRVDDTEVTFGKRYEEFLIESQDIIHFFEQKQTLFKVDCDRPFGNIYAEIMQLVKDLFSGAPNEGNGL